MTQSVPQRKQQREQAMLLILEGKSDSEIALEIGVTRATIWKWRSDPYLAAQIEKHNAKRLRAGATRLQSLTDNAIDALSELLRDQDPRARMVRLKAAIEILDRVGLGSRDDKLRAAFERDVAEFIDEVKGAIPKEALAQVIDLAATRTKQEGA